MEVVERIINMSNVYKADESLLAGTLFYMIPVTQFNGIPIEAGKVEQGFSYLIKQWSENMTGGNIKQIQDWNTTDTGQKSEAPRVYAIK